MKPMLATNVELAMVRYPVIVSPKLDGVRGLVIDGKLMSRTLKPIPNLAAQKAFGDPIYNGLDGELIAGASNSSSTFRQSSSIAGSVNLRDRLTFYVFDLAGPGGYIDRLQRLTELLNAHPHPQIVLLECDVVHNEAELLAYEINALRRGFEGVMLRKVHGAYKHGRSTTSEGILLKLKRFEDSEAEIIGFEEEQANNNVATRNELGRTARSTAKAGKAGKGSLGALVGRDIKTGIEFSCGTGFTLKERDWFWRNRDKLLGELFKFKHQPHGAKDKPRFPVYLGLRGKWDIT
jgi:DNA ligase-1